MTDIPKQNSNTNTNTNTKDSLQGYLRLPQVLEIIPVGRSTWYAGVKHGRYPQPVKLGPGTTAWKTEDIQTLILNLNNQSMR